MAHNQSMKSWSIAMVAAAIVALCGIGEPVAAQAAQEFAEQTLTPSSGPQDDAPPVDPYWQWRFEANAAAFYRQKVDLEGENSRLGSAGGILSLKAGTQINRELSTWARLIYTYESYDFGGSGGPTGWGSISPWGDVHTFDFTLNFSYDLTNEWIAFGGPVLRTSKEWDADFRRSFTIGGYVGAAYRFNEDLTVGLGVGLTEDIRESNRVFPIIVVDWNIGGGFYLKTYNAQNFTGVELTYDFDEHWQGGIGVATQYKQFVLDGNGIAPGGVGREDTLPLWGRISWKMNDNLRFDLQGGVMFDVEIDLFDKERVPIRSGKTDEPQPFASLNLRLEF